MRIKDGFVLRKVMGISVVIAVGEASKNFRGMVKLNDTASDIWTLIENGHDEKEICDILFKEYDIERSVVERDVSDAIGFLSDHCFIEL